MSEQNVEVIRRGFEIFSETGELPSDMIDPDVEIRDFDLPDAVGEVYRGPEGYERWLSLWSSAWEQYEIELEQLIDAGERVIAVIRLRARGKGSGVETERENGIVYTIRDRKVVRGDYFRSKEGALAAAGVSHTQRAS